MFVETGNVDFAYVKEVEEDSVTIQFSTDRQVTFEVKVDKKEALEIIQKLASELESYL
jgi:hypothetical protein